MTLRGMANGCCEHITCMALQVVSTVDPFGYYSEGIQQGLDDAFSRPRLQTDGSPSPRPATAPWPSS